MLYVGEEEVPLNKPSRTSLTCCRVVAHGLTVAPPLSEALIPGRLLNPSTVSKWGVVEPKGLSGHNPAILIAKALVAVGGEDVPVRVLNVSEKPQRIK